VSRFLVLSTLLFACGAGSRHIGDDIASDGDSDSDVDVDVDVDVDADADADEYAYDAGPDPGRECVPRMDNTPPNAPSPLYPVGCLGELQPAFAVANGSDPDGDVLRYHFRTDWEPSMRSMDQQETPPDGVPEGPAGVTSWRPPRPLFDELPAIYWDAWVDDCIADSEHVVTTVPSCAE